METVKPFDTWHFSGDEETYSTISNAAAVDATIGEIGLVTITVTDHGMKAPGVANDVACCYIKGSTNYSGIRRIWAVATNTITIYAKYVAETFAGTETVRTGYSSPHPFDLLGFRVTLDTASATSENITCDIDANAGAAYDSNEYTLDMDTVKVIDQVFDEPIACEGGDVIDIAWANTDNRLWGIKIFTRRR